MHIPVTTVPLFSVFLLIPISICVHIADGSEQVHLSFGPLASQIIVTWVSLTHPPNNSLVRYGEINAVVQDTVTGSWKEFRPSVNRLIHVHRALLTDLRANTSYEYSLQEDGVTWSPTFSFQTLANGYSSDRPLRLAILGDLGLENSRAVPFLRQASERRDFDAMFHVGDMAYDMDEEEGRTGDAFLNMMQPLAATVPYHVLPGNHEQSGNFSHYDALFSMPSFGGREDGDEDSINNFYHSVDIGPLHVVSITDDFYFYPEYGTAQIMSQYNWLVQDLEKANEPKNREQRPWIIVLSHRPMYCSAAVELFTQELRTVREGLNASFGLEQVIHDYKVDLFISGHIHLYERTYPMFQFRTEDRRSEDPYLNAGLPVHVVTGAGGCKHRLLPFLTPQPQYSAFRVSEYSYSLMSASPDKLRLQQISAEDGRVIDDFLLRKT